MSLQIGNAFQTIIGKDGTPLDSGFVYIGESGQNSEAYPVPIFYDENLTIPAPQPLRTINGYFSRNGSPAKIFIGSSSCSITVRDKLKNLQWVDLGYTGVLNQEIQDEIKRGIANRYDPALSYNVGDIVLLADGTEVISTIPSNTNDPNINMTGWKFNNDFLDSVAEMLSISSPKNGMIISTKSYYAGLHKGGVSYVYDSTRTAENDGGSVINGWVAINITSNVEQWGAKLDGVTNDTSAVLNALTVLGEAEVIGDTVLDRFDFPQGAKLVGKSNIIYTRLPSVACELDSSISVDHSKMKAAYVYGVFDICDMLQIKTAGFNTIIHYGYALAAAGGTFEKAINAAESIGLKVIMNSPNDVPPTGDVSLINNRDAIIGVYLFDEPQHSGVSVSAQNTRINAWRAVTDKQLYAADNGLFGFENNTISDAFDVVFADIYYIAANTDAENKLFGVMGYSELTYKCRNSKIIPAVGLFKDTANFTNKAKNISFAKELYKCGDGEYAAFAWDVNDADNTIDGMTNDVEFYETAKLLNISNNYKPYVFDIHVFGNNSGLNELIDIYDKNYSDTDIKPYAVINAGSAIDERQQTFADRGIGIANNGGIFASLISSRGYVASELRFYNHVDGGNILLTPFKTVDDYYSVTNLDSSAVLTNGQGLTKGYTLERGYSFGLNLIPSTTSPYFFKFVSGAIVSSSWENSTF